MSIEEKVEQIRLEHNKSGIDISLRTYPLAMFPVSRWWWDKVPWGHLEHTHTYLKTPQALAFYAAVNEAIRDAPVAICLISPIPYIRECKKWYLKQEGILNATTT